MKKYMLFGLLACLSGMSFIEAAIGMSQLSPTQLGWCSMTGIPVGNCRQFVKNTLLPMCTSQGIQEETKGCQEYISAVLNQTAELQKEHKNCINNCENQCKQGCSQLISGRDACVKGCKDQCPDACPERSVSIDPAPYRTMTSSGQPQQGGHAQEPSRQVELQ